jgi:hypothetical protein
MLRLDSERQRRWSVTTVIIAVQMLATCLSTGSAMSDDRTALLTRWLLIGTIVLEAPDRGLAIIEDRLASTQRFYRVGENVGEFRIIRVDLDKIAVAADGHEWELRLGTGTGATPAPLPPSVRGTSLVSVDRDRLVRLKDGIEPVTPVTGDERKGVRLGEISRSGILFSLGLREGDVVRDVGGKAPSSWRSLSQAIVDQASAGPMVRVHIERGGQPDSIYVDVR